MMKKKNVAMAMAATMMASAVAPVVANAADYEMNADKNGQLLSQLKALLKQTFIEDGVASDESLYEIQVSTGATVRATADTLKDIAKIEAVLNNAKENSTNVTVTVIEKAYTKEANGDITKGKIPTYTDENALRDAAEEIDPAEDVATGSIVINNAEYNANDKQLEIKLLGRYESTSMSTTSAQTAIAEINKMYQNGIEIKNVTTGAVSGGGTTTCAVVGDIYKTITLKVGDEMIDIDNVISNKVATLLENITFTTTTGTVDSVKNDFNSAIQKLNNITGFASTTATTEPTTMATVEVYPNAKLETVEATDLLNNGILTEEGQELLEYIGSTYTKDNTTTYTVKVKNTTDAFNGVFDEEKVNGKTVYSKTIELEGTNGVVARTGETDSESLVRLTITASTRSDLTALLNAIEAKNDDGYEFGDVEAVYELSGGTRFETAIEISKQAVNDSANAVVLVGENAVVDGLAAGPLAAQLDTSILLTGKDSVKANIVSEIERVLDVENSTKAELKNKTIYLVGGVDVISEAVVEQLSKLGVKVERLAGDTRYETSMEIAKEISKINGTDASTKAYVVGGDGLADAMSISAVASKKNSDVVSPIIVANKDSIDVDTLETIVDDYTNVDIIGGTAVVSEDVEAQLVDELGSKNVVRVKGGTREETNAAVINKYFGTATDKVFVTNNGFVSGINTKGNDQLIDAMTVAPLAGKVEAPIVLTGNELSESQEEALEIRTAVNASVTKVGGTVVQTVIEKIAKLTGISK